MHKLRKHATYTALVLIVFIVVFHSVIFLTQGQEAALGYLSSVQDILKSFIGIIPLLFGG